MRRFNVLKTLHARLLAVLVCFAIVMALLFLVVTRHLDSVRSQELNQKLYRTLASQLVSEHILPEIDNLDVPHVQRVFDRLRVINPRIDVYLLDANGKITASSVRTAIVRDHVNLAPLRAFLGNNPDLPILGDDPTEASRQRVFSAAAISSTRQANGYLYLIMRGLISDSTADRVQSSYVLRQSLWMITWGLAFALLASFWIVRFMTRPLRQLTAVMDKFQQSGFAVQFAKLPGPQRKVRDEVTQLTETFNAMADRLLAQMQLLQQGDSQRRELVANISHDLRTPLASLQGYLETLQVKGDALSADEKRSYLETALQHSMQLSRLVSALFELAKLDTGQAAILLERFELEDLVQDVVQQYELLAAGKNIRLSADMPAELPLVVADIGMIERVLRNLIDNALRHTPVGGAIMVKLAPGDRRVTVEVTDTGEGIAADDLPHIFERFYRGEKSRGDSLPNAGLGLAIARRIVELHGATLNVASHPGLTTFGFTLAYADRATLQAAYEFAPCPGAFPLRSAEQPNLVEWAKQTLG